MAKKGTKVFWKPEETEFVAAHLWNSGVRADSRPMTRFVREAQEAFLPEARWRVLVGTGSVSKVVELLKTWAAEKRDKVEPPALPYKLPVKRGTRQAAKEAPAQAAPAAPPASPSPEEPHDDAARVLGLLGELDGTLKALAGMLAGRFLQHLQSELSQQATGRLSGLVDAVSLEHLRTRRPRVAILGLAPREATAIQKVHGKHFNLEFWTDEGDEKLKLLAGVAEHILAMTGRVSRHAVSLVKEHPGYRRIGGGVPGIGEALAQLHVEN